LIDLSALASHFVEDWVRIGFPAKMKVKSECSELCFEEQCAVLEKVNHHMMLSAASQNTFC
jgi:hypothetical protein